MPNVSVWVGEREVKIPAPPPDDGVHHWIARASRSLERQGVEEGDAIAAIESLEDQLRRPFGAGEVDRSVAHIYATEPAEGRLVEIDEGGDPMPSSSCATLRPPPRLRVRRDTGKIPQSRRDPELIEVIASDPDAWTVERMLVESPRNVNAGTRKVLAALYPDDPLLCMGNPGKWDDRVLRVSEIGRDCAGLAQIVPNPMTARKGLTQLGKSYPRTLANTGSRRYLVTEFDKGSFATQAAMIGHLRDFLDLRLVMSSGGKSLHAWWDVEGIDDEELSPFWRYATQLGADPAMWTRCQYARMPNGFGIRKPDDPKHPGRLVRQSIFYLNTQP